MHMMPMIATAITTSTRVPPFSFRALRRVFMGLAESDYLPVSCFWA
jgi:hypothetical protein